mmetsp:Transcript_13106/g.31185  ORF Transcript_13106/g.31185 Transcript_13106/m.31185 type:complete len:179 (+) Transcript_13106:643-1179(+)
MVRRSLAIGPSVKFSAELVSSARIPSVLVPQHVGHSFQHFLLLPIDAGEQLVGEGDEMMSLHGIKERAPVGLLALNEAHGHCTVGDNYKSPEEPIWLCFMESHYSVLFGIEMPPAHGPFDLHFYDELGNQDEHIRLTIDPGREALPPANPDLVPPLELTIRTKWAHAFIDWNGTDPLL